MDWNLRVEKGKLGRKDVQFGISINLCFDVHVHEYTHTSASVIFEMWPTCNNLILN